MIGVLVCYVIASWAIFAWATFLYFDYRKGFIDTRDLWLRGGAYKDYESGYPRYKSAPARSDRAYMKMVSIRKDARRAVMFAIAGLFLVWPVALIWVMLYSLAVELDENNNFEDIKTNE